MTRELAHPFDIWWSANEKEYGWLSQNAAFAAYKLGKDYAKPDKHTESNVQELLEMAGYDSGAEVIIRRILGVQKQ
jgi:hypothetical protein